MRCSHSASDSFYIRQVDDDSLFGCMRNHHENVSIDNANAYVMAVFITRAQGRGGAERRLWAEDRTPDLVRESWSEPNM